MIGLTSVLEKSVNLALQQDPVSLARLKPLAGQIILLQLTAPALTLYLSLKNDRINFLSQCEQPPHTTIKGSLATFVGLWFSSQPMSMVMDGRLTVSGNWQLINELQQLFSQLYIDWPHVIVSGLGPVLGGQVVRTLIASQSWSKQVSRNFCVNLTNYLTEESRLLLTEEESHGFYQQVDQLALATDRLTARLAQLTQRLNVSA